MLSVIARLAPPRNELSVPRRQRSPAPPAPCVPLTSICNGGTPPSLRQPPSDAPPPGPGEPLRAPGPDDHTLRILGKQIHALLDQIRPGAPAGFITALDALALDPRETLTRKQCSQLLRALQTLPPKASVPERQRVLRNALYDLIRAARAEAMLLEQLKWHTEREKGNALPGSHRTVDAGGMLGLGFGLPGAEVRGAAGGLYQHSVAMFDDMAVAEQHSATLRAEALAQAQLAPGVGVQGKVTGHTTASDLDISLSMQTYVLRQAHASVARRLGGNALQRAFKRLAEPRRDRYDERCSRALAWQSRLPMLLGRQAVAQPLAFSRRGLLIDAHMTTHGGGLEGSASYGIGHLGGGVAVSHTELFADLPTRLTELGGDGRPAGNDERIRSVLEARLLRRLEHTQPPHAPALQQIRHLMKHPCGPRSVALREEAVAQVGAAFDHLLALAELSLRAPAQARAPLASLARDWGCRSRAIEPVMIGMLDTLAWLQAAPEPPAGPAHGAWERLQQRVQSEARRIHDTPMPHDRQQVYRATHAFCEQIQRINTKRGHVSLSLDLPGSAGSVQLGIAHHDRDDPDPMRDGTYWEVSFAASLAPNLGAILAALQRRFPQLGALPLDEAQALIDPLALGASVAATAQVTLRWFRPCFHRDPAFPSEGCDYHPYSVRVGTGTTVGGSLTVPLPFLPAATPSITVQYTRDTLQTQYDRLCAGTLASALLRYRSLRSDTTPDVETWAGLLDTHGADLDRLAKALTNAHSVPAREAHYWLTRTPATSIGGPPTRCASPDLATLNAFGSKADASTRRTQLLALFNALSDIVDQQKAMSPLRGPPVLRRAG